MFCGKVKEFLSQNKIESEDRNIAADEAALNELEKLGYMTTPVIVIDGEIVVGFDAPNYEACFSSTQDDELEAGASRSYMESALRFMF
jgi:glutaredoxin